MEHERTAVECRYKRAAEVEEDEHQETEDKGVTGRKGQGGMVRRDTRNFVIAFQTTLCTPMDSTNQLITVMTRVHQFALIF